MTFSDQLVTHLEPDSLSHNQLEQETGESEEMSGLGRSARGLSLHGSISSTVSNSAECFSVSTANSFGPLKKKKKVIFIPWS